MIDVWPLTRKISQERARELAEAMEANRQADELLEKVQKHGEKLAELVHAALATGRRPNGNGQRAGR